MENSTFLDYRIPTTLDLPMIDTVIVEVPNPGHPFGVRGVGEANIAPPPAAIAAAIANATGVRLCDLPMRPDRIAAAIAEKREADSLAAGVAPAQGPGLPGSGTFFSCRPCGSHPCGETSSPGVRRRWKWSGGTVREIVAELEARFPGIRERLVDDEEDRIRRNIAGAVDGEVSREGMRRKVPEGGEVHFLPAMSGGS